MDGVLGIVIQKLGEPVFPFEGCFARVGFRPRVFDVVVEPFGAAHVREGLLELGVFGGGRGVLHSRNTLIRRLLGGNLWGDGFMTTYLVWHDSIGGIDVST